MVPSAILRAILNFETWKPNTKPQDAISAMQRKFYGKKPGVKMGAALTINLYKMEGTTTLEWGTRSAKHPA